MPIDPLTTGTAAATWLWDTYGKTITDKAIGEAKRRWQQFNWRTAAEEYRSARVASRSDVDDLLGRSTVRPR